MSKVLFAASTVGEPWWLAGEIVRDVLTPLGHEVEIFHESASNHNLPWIQQGRANIGITTPEHFLGCRQGRPEYEGAKLEDMRAICTIIRPSWLGLAVRADLGVTDLRQLETRKIPFSLFSPPPDDGTLVDEVLRYHGFSMEEAKSWGAKHFRWSGRRQESHVRDNEVNVFLGNIYCGYTPHGRFWYEATELYEMRFLDFEPKLIDQLVKHPGLERGAIPELLFRWIDREIPSVIQSQLVMYCRKDQPDELIGALVKAMDENAELFKLKRVPFYYERDRIGLNAFLPLHPAAERYYRSQGYATTNA